MAVSRANNQGLQPERWNAQSLRQETKVIGNALDI